MQERLLPQHHSDDWSDSVGSPLSDALDLAQPANRLERCPTWEDAQLSPQGHDDSGIGNGRGIGLEEYVNQQKDRVVTAVSPAKYIPAFYRGKGKGTFFGTVANDSHTSSLGAGPDVAPAGIQPVSGGVFSSDSTQ